MVLWLENPIVAWLTSIDVLSWQLHCLDLTPSGTGSNSGSGIVLVYVTQELLMARGISLNDIAIFEADKRPSVIVTEEKALPPPNVPAAMLLA